MESRRTYSRLHFFNLFFDILRRMEGLITREVNEIRITLTLPPSCCYCCCIYLMFPWVLFLLSSLPLFPRRKSDIFCVFLSRNYVYTDSYIILRITDKDLIYTLFLFNEVYIYIYIYISDKLSWFKLFYLLGSKIGHTLRYILRNCTISISWCISSYP